MGEGTKIEWCDHTFNPWWGCQRVSPGCEHCYAETFDKRVSGKEKAHWGPTAARRFFGDKHWAEPLKWNAAAEKAGTRHRVFCASMADVFEDRPELEPWRAKLFSLIESTRHLDWLLLTKRPENISPMMPMWGWAPPNVWMGTTVEDPLRCERIFHLSKVPASVHFLSCEPLIAELRGLDLHGIDWLICGGESGPGARSFDIEWARSLRDQCRRAGTAFFMKQLGVHTRMSPDGGDPLPMFFTKAQAGDLSVIPEDLRVRQFPEARHE